MTQAELDTIVESLAQKNIELMETVVNLRRQSDPVSTRLEDEHTFVINILSALENYDITSEELSVDNIDYLIELAKCVLTDFKFPVQEILLASTEIGEIAVVTTLSKKYESVITIQIGTTTIITDIQTEPYSIMILDADLNNITSLVGPITFAKVGSIYEIYIDSTEEIVDAKLKIIY